MKALLSLPVVFVFAIAIAKAENPAPLKAELQQYEFLSSALIQKVGKIENKARACYKELPGGYKIMVDSSGLFAKFSQGKEALSANLAAVKTIFNQLSVKIATPPDLSEVNSGSGATETAAKMLESDGISVDAAKLKLALIKQTLEKSRKDLANPKNRSNLEFLIGCVPGGNPEKSVSNFHEAIGDFDKLVASHEKLEGQLVREKSALASEASQITGIGRGLANAK